MRLILSGFLGEANSVKLKGKLRACEEITPLVAICERKKLRPLGSKGENEARFFAPLFSKKSGEKTMDDQSLAIKHEKHSIGIHLPNLFIYQNNNTLIYSKIHVGLKPLNTDHGIPG